MAATSPTNLRAANIGKRLAPFAKAGIAIFAVVGLLSTVAAVQALGTLRRNQQALVGARAQRAELDRKGTALQRKLDHFKPAKAKPIQQSAPAVLARLRRVAIDNGVQVETLTIAGISASGMRQPIRRVAQQDPKTGIMELKATVQGNYTDYAGLLKFLRAIKAMPVAIDGLRLNGYTVRLHLTVLGT